MPWNGEWYGGAFDWASARRDRGPGRPKRDRAKVKAARRARRATRR